MARHNQQSKFITLAETQKQFQLWRANKTSGERVPESLWVLVSQLLENATCKRSIIGRTLGISTSQLRNKFPGQFKAKSTIVPVRPKNHKPFVQASLDALISSTVPSTQLIIERNNGAKLIFSSLTQEQFSILIKTFVE